MLVSAATIWEIAIKIGLGKLTLTAPFREWMERVLVDNGMEVLPISVEHAAIQAELPSHHGDPFDRLLVAQAKAEDLSIVSGDKQLDAYAVSRLW